MTYSFEDKKCAVATGARIPNKTYFSPRFADGDSVVSAQQHICCVCRHSESVRADAAAAAAAAAEPVWSESILTRSAWRRLDDECGLISRSAGRPGRNILCLSAAWRWRCGYYIVPLIGANGGRRVVRRNSDNLRRRRNARSSASALMSVDSWRSLRGVETRLQGQYSPSSWWLKLGRRRTDSTPRVLLKFGHSVTRILGVYCRQLICVRVRCLCV